MSWHCGLDLRSAREKLRVGHTLADLPLIAQAFAAGRLSYSKVRVLTRVATPANEADLVMLATYATAAQVERSVRAYRGVLSSEEETARANERHAARYLRCDWDDDGMLAVNGRIPAEMGAIVLQAIDALRRSGAAATNADALLLMAESVMASGLQARKGSERHLVVVNVDADVLSGGAPEGECEIDGGPAIAPETARRLACDASIVWILDDGTGCVRNVSAKAPSIPSALRRAVHRRDRGCGFLGCGETSSPTSITSVIARTAGATS